MPNYDYICDKCNKSLELFLPMAKSDDVLNCECEGIMIKQLSPPTIKFKGHGFYKTDKRKKEK